MRILVVSAHYPPNFVSGGTLQPQRLAQGLVARGHEVTVYAGWLADRPGADATPRPAGTAWDEIGEDGLPIRWIAVTPWTAWDDRMNYDNPVVEADFRAHVRALGPDVVHFHSMQTLGGGLVPAAAAAGAATVITMHDFWWCCARQFLYDRTGYPCSLVVDAGVCECAAGRPSLDRRNQWLRDQLESADLVLSPSEPAVAVLAANGLATGRLSVDENGMTVGTRPVNPRRSGSSDGIRFVYAGGPEEMKGVHVIMAAARLLGDRQGWSLTAYGAGPWVKRNGGVDGLPISCPDPFAPSDLQGVLDATDVLVVPSVVRESHSLLTREALLAGVPIISSDCLGPEEVVVDGHNGLIVPIADSALLAAGMGRFLDEPDLLPRLRQGTTGVTVRPLAEQIEDLEARFEQLRETKEAARQSTKASVKHVLFIVGIDGAPLRYRVWLPVEGLALHGITSEVRWFTDPDIDVLAARADVVVAYRVPATSWVLQVIADTRAMGIPVLFDVDDLIFDPDIAQEVPAIRDMPRSQAALWMEGVRRYRTTMEACDAYIASTPLLGRRAETTVGLPVERFDNGVGVILGRLSDRALRHPRAPGPLRIGYFSGTDTHDADWAQIEPAVIEVLDRHPDVELWLGGLVEPTPALRRYADRTARLPFCDWRSLPEGLRNLDVNLCPLVAGSRFNEAKSAIKWLEAGLVGTATVASPTEPLVDAITDGVNGLLADDVEGWTTAIDRLLTDDVLRARLGHRARRDALMRWSPHLQGTRYQAILERTVARKAASSPAPRASTWSPVVVDDPISRRPIDPYTETPPKPTGKFIRRLIWRERDRAIGIAVRARRSLADEGFKATIAKLPRVAKRVIARNRIG